MLLVHGIHDHCHTWDWVAQSFRDRYHIVAPDFRGHGDSEWSKGSPYTHLEYVYDVAQLVRQQELAPTTVVSHSLGGTIAAMYAGIFPELVKQLVIVEGVGLYPGRYSGNPATRLRQWVDANYSLAGRIPRRYGSLEEAFQRMQETNPHLTPQQARHLTVHGSNQNEDGTYTWKFDNYTRAHTPYDVPSEDVIDLWKRIRCPVLIINSRQGYPHRIGQAGTLEHFADVRLVEIDEAGHWTHHDQLDGFVELVADFLGE